MKPADPCGRCPLRALGTGWVRGDGPQPADILLVGEAPGETEAKTGRPFTGAAGRMLDRLLGRAGLDRARFRVANVLCCRPPKNYLAGAPYEHAAIGTCSPLLDEEIALTRPKVIVALGNIPLRRLAKVSGISRYRGFPIRHPSGAWIVPTYHPSHLLPRKGQVESAKLTGMVILDLKKAVAIADHGFTPATSRYRLDPSPGEAAIFAVEYENAIQRGTAPLLSWDIETPGKMLTTSDDNDDFDEDIGSTQILRIGFAFSPGYAMSVQWSPEYIPVIRRILTAPGPSHVVWNGYAFDLPILEANGISVRNEIFDGMWGWHLLQSDLPRGLEAVTSIYAPELGAWKHLGSSEPARYNALDADAALRCMIGIERDLRDRGQWDLFLDHVVKLWPVLFMAGRRHGVAIDRKLQEELRAELLATRDRLFREAQRVVPDRHKTEKFYVRPPKDKPTVEVPGVATVTCCDQCGQERVGKSHFLKKCPTGMTTTKTKPVTRFRWTPEWEALQGEDLAEAVKLAGFNPISQLQLIRYAKAHSHPIGENYKTGTDQFDKKVRARLIKRFGESHPIYQISQDLSELTKTLSTYVDGFTPDSRGLIYTAYSFAPSTGRLSSRSVNLQNVSRGSNNRWATAIRRTIVPRDGRVFVEADSAAIEAVMTGFFMDDPEYIRLARAGVHDYVTCVELGLPFDPGELRAYRKDPRYAEARERNKRVVHGTNYGMTPKMMTMQYPEQFRTERDAAYAQQQYFKAVPRLPAWQHETRVLAHRQTFLQNPWGYRHYYYQVFERKTPEGEVTLGPDAKRVVAFLPQSSAAAFMRDTLRELGNSEWMQFAPAIVSIHDSVALEVPVDLQEHAVEWLLATLTRPIPQLNGLRIGCEVKAGRNWADMEVIARETLG